MLTNFGYSYIAENRKLREENKKLQKEIEELKFKYQARKDRTIQETYKKQIETCEQLQNYINALFLDKNKIREKIEKYKVLAEKSKTIEELYIYKNITYALQGLLEEK